MARIVLDFKDAFKKIKSLEDGFKDMSEFFQNVADLEKSSTLLRFLDEVSPSGEKWRTPFTIRRNQGGSSYSPSHAWHYWKKSNFHAIPDGWHLFSRGNDKVLRSNQGSGLFGSIGSAFGSDFAEIGTNLEYGKHLQNKGFEFLGVSETTEENIQEAFTAFVKGRL